MTLISLCHVVINLSSNVSGTKTEMAAMTTLNSSSLQANANSLDEVYSSLGTEDMRQAFKDSNLNRLRKFTAKTRVTQEPLLPKGLGDKLADAADKAVQSTLHGSEVMIHFSQVAIQVIPTVPEGYAGMAVFSLVDSGLAQNLDELPEQTEIVDLGNGPKLLLFDVHYTFPISDKGRSISVRIETDCAMASQDMSFMVCYAFWNFRLSQKAGYHRNAKSQSSQISVGYRTPLIKNKRQLQNFLSRSLETSQMISVKPISMPKTLNATETSVRERANLAEIQTRKRIDSRLAAARQVKDTDVQIN